MCTSVCVLKHMLTLAIVVLLRGVYCLAYSSNDESNLTYCRCSSLNFMIHNTTLNHRDTINSLVSAKQSKVYVN